MSRAQASTRLSNFVLTSSVLALVISFPAWPNTPYALYLTHVSRVFEIAARARAMEVGQAIREAAGGASVVYLARQDAQYFVGLPTDCRYPTATFLHLSARTADPLSLMSVQENLACLRDTSATFLVLQPPVTTLYQWRHRGDGPPGYRIGRHVRYRRAAVEAWLESQTDQYRHASGF